MARAAAFSRWELPEDQFKAVEEHLRGCPDCAKEVQALEQSEAGSDQPTADSSSPQEFTSRVMARIRGWETAQGGQRRRRLALRVAACFAIFLLPALAFVSHRDLIAPPDTVATLGVVSTQTTDRHPTSNETIDLGVAEQLQQEMANTLAALEAKAMLPRTDAELEAWARREYPADMWLYDLLRERFGYQGTWQHLFRNSGVFFCFDYPLTSAEPNCRTSIQALQRVARAAGYDLTLAPNGGILLPEDFGLSARPANRHIRLEKIATASTDIGPPLPLPSPVGYSWRIAATTRSAPSIISHLLVAGQLAEEPLSGMSPKWEALLRSAALRETTGNSTCHRETALAERLQNLLHERADLVRSIIRDNQE